MAQADVAAHALGPLEVRVGGHLVPRWNSLKARAVFQYLLVHQDRPTRRDVLMALQWPDHSHNSARNNLNVALYSLRNTLGPGQVAAPVGEYDVSLIAWAPDATAKPASVRLPAITIRAG
jgi:DNA-binding SARP family transcriptional activator